MPVFCRQCGKEIEAGARFCRFCGAAQVVAREGAPAGRSPTTPSRIERRLRHLFPRHHLQDDFMHIATIAAMVIAVVGFIVGLFPGLGGQIYGLTWLLFAIALLLFLMLRESTLNHARGILPRHHESEGAPTRYHAARTAPPSSSADPGVPPPAPSSPDPAP